METLVSLIYKIESWKEYFEEVYQSRCLQIYILQTNSFLWAFILQTKKNKGILLASRKTQLLTLAGEIILGGIHE